MTEASAVSSEEIEDLEKEVVEEAGEAKKTELAEVETALEADVKEQEAEMVEAQNKAEDGLLNEEPKEAVKDVDKLLGICQTSLEEEVKKCEDATGSAFDKGGKEGAALAAKNLAKKQKKSV